MIRFWGALCTTIGFIFIMDANDFFPDISSLYDNMGDNNDTPNPNANVGSSSASYVPPSSSPNLCFSLLY
jgi:hypothetical protein